MKKRTILKSVASFALAIVLLLAMSVPALAADGSITIKPNGQAKVGGATRFTAYQIFKGSTDTTVDQLVDVTWGDGVDKTTLIAEMKTSNLALDGETFGQKFTKAYDEWNGKYSKELDEAAFVAQWLGQNVKNTSYADDFARIVAKHIKGSQAKTSAFNFGETAWVISGLESGYYLVKDGYTSEEGHTTPDGSVSSYILQVVGNVEVDLKATIPTVEKKIVSGRDLVDGILTETETAVTYQLTGTVSENIGEYDKYEYKFTDTLSKGLTMTEDDLDKLTVKYVNGSTSETFTKPNDFTASKSETEETTLTVTFTDLKKSLENLDADVDLSKPETVKNIKIVVTYTAHLNENAVIGSAGNPNNVVLEYSNDPYSTGKGETVPDVVKTYTLALRIIKKGADGNTLPGVEFKLMKGTSTGTNQFAKFADGSGQDGSGKTENYKEIKSWPTGIENGDPLTTDAQGEFNIHGLSAGTYTLVETKAPEGYEIMKPVEFTITGSVNGTGALTNGSAEVEAEKRQDVVWNNREFSGHKAQLTLTNFKSPVLPHTGGTGARVIYIVSALAVLAGAAVVFAAVRKRGGGRHAAERR